MLQISLRSMILWSLIFVFNVQRTCFSVYLLCSVYICSMKHRVQVARLELMASLKNSMYLQGIRTQFLELHQLKCWTTELTLEF